MKLMWVAVFVACSAIAAMAEQQAPSAHYRAAEEMLNQLDMEKVMAQSIDEMIKAQKATNPGVEAYEDMLRDFLTKHMSWNAVKKEIIAIYMAEFSEEDLKEITRFYQSSVGKKWAEKVPTLLTKGSELGAKKLQEHMPEFQEAIKERLKQRFGR